MSRPKSLSALIVLMLIVGLWAAKGSVSRLNALAASTPTLAPTPIPAGTANDVWTPREQINGPRGLRLVQVPAGCFMMGSAEGESDEQPQHEVCLSEFWIGRTEVTTAHYWKCVDAGACTPPDNPASYDPRQHGDRPVVFVDWEKASAYAAWAGCALPTEAQWEYAARGPEGWLYPWGNMFDGTRLNYCDRSCDRSDRQDLEYDDGFRGEAPAASYWNGMSWVGAVNMSGNVLEWVADWYGAYPAERQTDPAGPASGARRVARGGSWAEIPDYARTAYRVRVDPNYRSYDLGFRVVCPAPQ